MRASTRPSGPHAHAIRVAHALRELALWIAQTSYRQALTETMDAGRATTAHPSHVIVTAVAHEPMAKLGNTTRDCPLVEHITSSNPMSTVALRSRRLALTRSLSCCSVSNSCSSSHGGREDGATQQKREGRGRKVAVRTKKGKKSGPHRRPGAAREQPALRARFSARLWESESVRGRVGSGQCRAEEL